MIQADRPHPWRPESGRDGRSRVSLSPDQAAAIPVREREGQTEILLVTSRRRGRWIVPKGTIERGSTPVETASAEAFEEGGVEGTVRSTPLGRYRHGRHRRASVVEVYLLWVDEEHDEWPERDDRVRRWVPASAAASRVDVTELRPILRRVAGLVQASGQSDAADRPGADLRA